MSPKHIFLIFAILVQYICWCQNFDNDTDCDEIVTYDVDTLESVKFYLLNPDNETIDLNSTNLDLIDTTLPTKIIIHGLSSYENTVWIDEMATNYHTKGNYNVIAVDWSQISTNDSFYVASAVDSLGNLVGDFILEITQTNVEHLEHFHVIGSSIGAQIGASAGQAVIEGSNSSKIGRITALDPTVPEDFGVLDKDVAEFVDVIHTTLVFAEKSYGTVDFYITSDDPTTPVCYNDTCGEPLGSTYFTKSIVDAQRFVGIPCYNASLYVEKLCNDSNVIPLGEYVSRNASGSYLVAKDGAQGMYSYGNLLLSLITVIVLTYVVY